MGTQQNQAGWCSHPLLPPSRPARVESHQSQSSTKLGLTKILERGEENVGISPPAPQASLGLSVSEHTRVSVCKHAQGALEKRLATQEWAMASLGGRM